MHPLHNFLLFIGRLLIAAVFIYDAWVMAQSWDATVQYMESFGIPGVLLPLVAACQAIGGLMIVFGIFTRFAAAAFAAYCIATALVFHHNLADAGEITQAAKDLAIAGGFLFLAASGPGAWAIDRHRSRGAV
jgi:putative oxidoreductase